MLFIVKVGCTVLVCLTEYIVSVNFRVFLSDCNIVERKSCVKRAGKMPYLSYDDSVVKWATLLPPAKQSKCHWAAAQACLSRELRLLDISALECLWLTLLKCTGLDPIFSLCKGTFVCGPEHFLLPPPYLQLTDLPELLLMQSEGPWVTSWDAIRSAAKIVLASWHEIAMLPYDPWRVTSGWNPVFKNHDTKATDLGENQQWTVEKAMSSVQRKSKDPAGGSKKTIR